MNDKDRQYLSRLKNFAEVPKRILSNEEKLKFLDQAYHFAINIKGKTPYQPPTELEFYKKWKKLGYKS